MVRVVKKDHTKEPFNIQKVVIAVNKSANRVLYNFTEDELKSICNHVEGYIRDHHMTEIQIWQMHNIVESALESVQPEVAKSYRDYRNYKQDFVGMLDSVYQKSQSIMYIGDKENSNTDSALVSTKRSLIFNQLNKELYQKFFMNTEELQACRDGYIYVHDMSARRDTMNCCLFDVASVLKDGCEMGNLWYNEPKTLNVAFDVIGDIVLSAASQQYGGFTVPSVDLLLEPYAERSYKMLTEKYTRLGLDADTVEKEVMADILNDFEQGFQGWEYKFNTVASSRGDYPFITMTMGTGTGRFAKLASITMLNVRRKGQGKKGQKKPVLFPKIVFLYDENLHGPGKPLEDVFEAGILCSSRAMYPDWLSLTGEGYVPSMYKKYGAIISPMGCRAFLSPWFERGGMKPADENDKPVFVGRWNIGAVSLHLPMIYAKAQQENRPFHEVLDYYLELIRKLHIRTYAYLGEMCIYQSAGVLRGRFLRRTSQAVGQDQADHEKPLPRRSVSPRLTSCRNCTTANRLPRTVSLPSKHCSISTIRSSSSRTRTAICMLSTVHRQRVCAVCRSSSSGQKYGIIEGVSDRPYVSNSFHCHVTEDLTPIQKQDLEGRFWNLCNGGKIQYVKYPIDYNHEAIRSLVRRAMAKGFYEGVNLSLAYCDDCGHEELSMDVCPKCGSRNLTKIERMNGYLSYSRVKGDTRLNDAKMAEIAERKSM